MSEYDDRGRVTLWKPDTDHPRAPVLSGTVCAHRNIREGEYINIGLWKSKSENPRAPVLIGMVSDTRREERAERPARSAPPPPPKPQRNVWDDDPDDSFKDDDVPF